MKDEPEGSLSKVALEILMKILHRARYCRPDILLATCAMARRVIKLTTVCDRRLHRLVSYAQLTRLHKQCAFVGGEFRNFTHWHCSQTQTVAAIGPRTCVPIKSISKKQTFQLDVRSRACCRDLGTAGDASPSRFLGVNATSVSPRENRNR